MTFRLRLTVLRAPPRSVEMLGACSMVRRQCWSMLYGGVLRARAPRGLTAPSRHLLRSHSPPCVALEPSLTAHWLHTALTAVALRPSPTPVASDAACAERWCTVRLSARCVLDAGGHGVGSGCPLARQRGSGKAGSRSGTTGGGMVFAWKAAQSNPWKNGWVRTRGRVMRSAAFFARSCRIKC